MSENTANGMIEEITTESGETIKLDAMFIMDSIDDVTALVDANVNILKSVRSIIKRGVASGLTASQASAIALEFQKRAAKKSNDLVHYDNEEGEKSTEDNDTTNEQLKKDIYEACHIVFDTIEEAEKAKRDILNIFNRIRYVTIADIYALTGKNLEASNPACGYGWEKLPEIDIFLKENEEYILVLPEPKKLSENKGVKEDTDKE